LSQITETRGGCLNITMTSN